MGKHRQYTDEFKYEALRLAETSGKSIAELERDLVRAILFDYIEVWYNRQRLHSSLGYRSPAAFEQLHAA